MLDRDASVNHTNEHDVAAGDASTGACPSSEQKEVSETCQQAIVQESVSATITSIQSALQQINASGDYSVFVSREVVARPPFPYFYGLIQCINKARPSLGWKDLLLKDAMILPQTRKEKVRG